MAITLVLGGCGGGGATTEVSTKTLGQELTDLQQAYDAGAISESEYEKAKKALLKKYK
jgi:hypothetical protein